MCWKGCSKDLFFFDSSKAALRSGGRKTPRMPRAFFPRQPPSFAPTPTYDGENHKGILKVLALSLVHEAQHPRRNDVPPATPHRLWAPLTLDARRLRGWARRTQACVAARHRGGARVAECRGTPGDGRRTPGRWPRGCVRAWLAGSPFRGCGIALRGRGTTVREDETPLAPVPASRQPTACPARPHAPTARTTRGP